VHIPSTDLTATGQSAIDEADLVVTGIHARHILKDLFVGSFTRAMIDRGDTALFMSH
jgi:nucleotide-binding universal stress UspA family protein